MEFETEIVASQHIYSESYNSVIFLSKEDLLGGKIPKYTLSDKLDEYMHKPAIFRKLRLDSN